MPDSARLTVLLTALLTPACVNATGPSHLYMRMLPVSVSDEGAVLCRTVCLSNPEGVSGFLPVSYGWAVIDPAGAITQYPWVTIDPLEPATDEQVAEAFEAMDNELRSPLDFSSPPVSLLPVLAGYGFSCNNAGSFAVIRMLSCHEFMDAYGLDRDSMGQLTLHDGYLSAYHDSVLVSYDFGGVLLLENSRDPNTGTATGAVFEATEARSPKDAGDYESYTISGVVFIP